MTDCKNCQKIQRAIFDRNQDWLHHHTYEEVADCKWDEVDIICGHCKSPIWMIFIVGTKSGKK